MSDIDAIRRYVRQRVSADRYRHTLATLQLTEHLAAKHHVPAHKAALAAILHDVGKGMTGADMVDYVRRHRVSAHCRADIILHHPELLHGYIGAHIARTQCGVCDREVLAAIRLHTLGEPRMTTLAKILFVADMASHYPGPAARRLMRLAAINLDHAVRAVLVDKLTYVIRHHGWIHPQAVAVWNGFYRQENLQGIP